jgi:hypothetical protein
MGACLIWLGMGPITISWQQVEVDLKVELKLMRMGHTDMAQLYAHSRAKKTIHCGSGCQGGF